MFRKHVFTLLIVAALLAAMAGCSSAPAGNVVPVTTTAPKSTAASTGGQAAPPSASAANAAVKVARVQGFGLFLTDNAGRTLYAYASDSKDTSNCTGACSQNWPPFIAPATPRIPSNLNASLLTTFKRPDGTMQVEYDGHPLYYYAGDQNPGDIKGQSVGNMWHVLSPRGNPMLNPYSPSATRTP